MAGLSVRYATALFEIAMESGTVDETLPQAIFLRDTLKDPDCQKVIAHPHITTAEKMDFFDKAFAGSISEQLIGFLHLAIAKDRESYLVQALTDYIDMVNRYKQKTVAQVVSANALTDGQLSQLKASLSQKLNKQVDLEVKVNPGLMGGLTVFVDGYLIDRSLKKKFYDLKEDLKVV